VARQFDPYKLSNPSLFLMSMVIFLIITGFLSAILYRQIFSAFQSNPGLNGLIVGVLAIGILLALAQVIRLIPEVKWVNSFRLGNPDLEVGREPVLLAPMKALLGQTAQDMTISTLSMRSILDSIGNRLDESRDISVNRWMAWQPHFLHPCLVLPVLWFLASSIFRLVAHKPAFIPSLKTGFPQLPIFHQMEAVVQVFLQSVTTSTS